MTGSHDSIGNHMTNQETMTVTKLQNKRHETWKWKQNPNQRDTFIRHTIYWAWRKFKTSTHSLQFPTHCYWPQSFSLTWYNFIIWTSFFSTDLCVCSWMCYVINTEHFDVRYLLWINVRGTSLFRGIELFC